MRCPEHTEQLLQRPYSTGLVQLQNEGGEEERTQSLFGSDPGKAAWPGTVSRRPILLACGWMDLPGAGRFSRAPTKQARSQCHGGINRRRGALGGRRKKTSQR